MSAHVCAHIAAWQSYPFGLGAHFLRLSACLGAWPLWCFARSPWNRTPRLGPPQIGPSQIGPSQIGPFARSDPHDLVRLSAALVVGRSGPSLDRSGPRPLCPSAALSLGRSGPRPLRPSFTSLPIACVLACLPDCVHAFICDCVRACLCAWMR